MATTQSRLPARSFASVVRRCVEFPVDWTLDDFPHYAHSRDFRFMMPISSPQKAMEVCRAEFDAAWEFGALWITVWHPFLSGRLARFKAVLELLDHMRSKGASGSPGSTRCAIT